MQVSSPATSRALTGWAIVLVAAVAGLAGAAAAGAAEQEAPLEPLVANPDNGQLLYAQQCARCHGADGRGGPMQEYEGIAPSLRPDDNPNIEVAYLDLVFSTGRMPPAGSPYDNRTREVVLDEQERADLVAWMADEFDIDGEIPEVAEGSAARGQQVWNANCSHCHGATGAGGVAGAGAWTPSVSDKSAQTIAEAIRVGPFQMPQFEAGQISDQEIADVVAFMNEVQVEADEQILGIPELNPVFASAFVFLLALAALFLIGVIGSRPRWFPTPPEDLRRERRADVPAGAQRRAPADRGES